MKSTIYPIDIETGEVVSGVVMSDEEDRKRQKEYWEKQNAKKQRRANHKRLGNFYMSACRENQFLGLSPQDIARLIYLASFMGYGNILQRTEREKIKVEELPGLLNVSKSTFDRFWGKVKGRFIIENKDGSLTATECFFRGKQSGINERVTKIFIQQVRELYRNTPVSKHRYLGYVFALLNCVNVQFNLICTNPLESNLDQVLPITLKDFCEKVGYDTTHMSRLKKIYSEITFMCDGESRHFCAFVNCGRKTDDEYVVVNPRIFYAGTCFEQVEVLGLFFK